jgi:hypothetical protein
MPTATYLGPDGYCDAPPSRADRKAAMVDRIAHYIAVKRSMLAMAHRLGWTYRYRAIRTRELAILTARLARVRMIPA